MNFVAGGGFLVIYVRKFSCLCWALMNVGNVGRSREQWQPAMFVELLFLVSLLNYFPLLCFSGNFRPHSVTPILEVLYQEKKKGTF